MSRYPYTEAYDYVRSHVAYYDERLQMRRPTINRLEAAQAVRSIAEVLGMDAEQLAIKIADYARAKGDEAMRKMEES